MTQTNCPACGAANDAQARFCAQCGTALPIRAVEQGEPSAAPTGWDLATAAMASPADDRGRGRVFKNEEYANWGQRFGGSLLDNVLIALASCAVLGMAALIWLGVDSEGLHSAIDSARDSRNDQEADSEVVIALVSFIVFAVVSNIAWDVLWVRSRGMGKPGQRIAGFRVANADGSRVTTGRAFGRMAARLVYNVPYIGFFLCIATAVTIGASQRRQALHDMLAGTVCVKTSALTARALGPKAAHGALPVVQAIPMDSPSTAPSLPQPPSSGPFV
ncbi:MAG: domain containing protein [Thermoleophilia bacterium]|nr:domain containing protein [Thermoleophilia bacterium]